MANFEACNSESVGPVVGNFARYQNSDAIAQYRVAEGSGVSWLQGYQNSLAITQQLGQNTIDEFQRSTAVTTPSAWSSELSAVADVAPGSSPDPTDASSSVGGRAIYPKSKAAAKDAVLREDDETAADLIARDSVRQNWDDTPDFSGGVSAPDGAAFQPRATLGTIDPVFALWLPIIQRLGLPPSVAELLAEEGVEDVETLVSYSIEELKSIGVKGV